MRESISRVAQASAFAEASADRGILGGGWSACALRPRVERTLQRARSRLWLAAALLAAAPASALACPVCGLVGTSDNTWAYQAMTATLTLLPLAMIGATVWWLARLVARADTERPPARSAGKQILPLARRSQMLAGPEAKPR